MYNDFRAILTEEEILNELEQLVDTHIGIDFKKLLSFSPTLRDDLTGYFYNLLKKSGIKATTNNPKEILRRDMEILKEGIRNDERLKEIFLSSICPSTKVFHRDNIGEHVYTLCEKIGKKRVLSAGCSFGTELYSIAFCFLDKGISLSEVNFVGVDVNSSAVAKAQEGIYIGSDLAVYNGFSGKKVSLSSDHIEKYLIEIKQERWETGGKNRIKYHVRNDISDALCFYARNIIDENALISFPVHEFDVVCCRNTLKYLNSEKRKKALKNLREIISTDGVLVIGNEHEGDIFWDDLWDTGFRRSALSKEECPIYVKAGY